MDINELKLKLNIVKENYLNNKDYNSFHKYYMIVCAYYELVMIEKQNIEDKEIYEFLLENLDIISYDSEKLINIEKEKINEMQENLKNELDIKILKK